MLLVLACSAALLGVVHTARWPLTGDSAVLHYANFLASQGKVPYQDFVEPDLPGAYLEESFGMHVFGAGDLGWHMYDLALLGLLCGAAIAICKPYDWLAGWLGGVSFALVHLAYGPRNAGQREEVMTVCLMLGIAFLFQAHRSRKAWPMLLFGLFTGLASSIKPPACLIGVLALLMLVFTLRRERVAAMPFCGLALSGFFAAASLNIFFLWHYHAFHGFLLNVRLLIPYYSRVARASVPVLLKAIIRPIRGAALLGLPLAFLQRKANRAENWERSVLLMIVGSSLVSHLVQRKNFEHHLYAFYAFVLLFFFLEVSKALSKPGALRLVGAVAASYGMVIVAFYAYQLHRFSAAVPATPAMMADLSRLGGQKLNGKVQCFDLVLACSSAMYRLRIVEDLSFANDFTVLPSAGVAPLPYYQELLWKHLQSDPPEVILVTNQQLEHPAGFDKLDQWPEFKALLQTEYSLYVTRVFGLDAYRVYVHKSPSAFPVPASTSPPKQSRAAASGV